MSEESFVYTACPGWGDHEYCAIKTIVKDGEIVRTEKVRYTGADAEEGYICQKGLASCRQPYNKDRLLYPLKRVGERGEGKWERIGWDQALDEIAQKLDAIRKDYGPESVAMWNLTASVPPSGGLNTVLGERFMDLFGMTNGLVAQGLDNGPVYSNFYTFGNGAPYMLTDPANFDDSDCIIVWGANPIENQQRVAKHIVEAKSRGCYLVDVGLVFDATAGYSDWFVPATPGSDPYLALAMARVIVDENLYDRDFLVAYSVATYLVDIASGQFVRDGEGNYLVWDMAASMPVPVAPQGGSITAQEPALDGVFTFETVTCKPVFQMLREHLVQYDLVSAEKITRVAAADIKRLAETYAAAKNAYIIGALGLRYENQGESYRAFHMLGTLTGNLGRPGAGVTCELVPTSYPLMWNDYPIMRPNGKEGRKAKFVRMDDFFEQIKTDQPYPIKAMLTMAGNPVHNNPNRDRWIKAFDKMDLVVDYDIWMTDTSELADYVLPDCMPFEREELIVLASYNHVVLQEPAIEPRGEAKDPTFLYTELAKRLGLGEYFDKTCEEWLEARLMPEYPLLAPLDPPLTWERLKKEKMIRSVAPDQPKFDPFMGLKFMTATGRIEFYADRLVDLGFGFPTYFPPIESPVIDGNEKFPYQLFTGRQRFFMQSMFTDDPLMVELSGGAPSARMNPIDAERKGIQDGDKVEVYNDRGHTVIPMRLDQAIPPQTIQIWFGWRKKHFEDGMYSEMLVPLADKNAVTNDLALKWWSDWQDTGHYPESGMVDATSTLGGTWDTMWDCACNVRKVEEEKEA